MIGGKWKRASCTLPTSGAGLVCRSCVVQGSLRCYYSGTRRIIGVRAGFVGFCSPLGGFGSIAD
jgi:hypothetical protein